MNRNLKIKLVALFATLSGAAISDCRAVQTYANSGEQTAVVQAAESGFSGGAFGAIRPVNQSWNQQSTLPPIVSADSIEAQETGQTLPPIVSAESMEAASPMATAQNMPPIVSVEQSKAELAQSQAQSAPTLKTNMLVPIVVAEPAAQPAPVVVAAAPQVNETGSGTIQSTWAPAPSLASASQAGPAPAVIQATAAPTQGATDTNIQQAQWGMQAGFSGRSTAGVPIYTQDAIGQLPGEVVTGSAPANVPPIVSADSTMTSVPPIVSGNAQLVSPQADMVVQQAMPMGTTVMQAPATGQTYFGPTVSDAPVIVDSGCNSCGNSGCVGGCSTPTSTCQSCGPGGCYNEGSVQDQFGCCGSVYSARRYFIADALYFTRDDGTISNANYGALANFDWDWGGRITFGNRADATSGRELVYTGILPLEESQSFSDPGGRINSNFVSVGGFTGIETTAFFNAVNMTESKETQLHSFEYNKVKWGWDVIKTYYGFRYMYVNDEYYQFSQNITGTTGTYELQATNHMFGPHIGGELFYDVGYRLSWSFLCKGGVYVNFNQFDTDLINGGIQFLNAEDNNVTVSGSIEMGLISHYQLSRRARFRAGYNVLWLGDVASVSDNYTPFISSLTGSDTGDSDDMFFHGLSVGLEVYR